MIQGDVFLILYSITDRSSFEEADRIASFIKDGKNVDSIFLILVGTKKDLEHFREVDESEGSDLAQQAGVSFLRDFHLRVRRVQGSDRYAVRMPEGFYQKGQINCRKTTFFSHENERGDYP